MIKLPKVLKVNGLFCRNGRISKNDPLKCWYFKGSGKGGGIGGRQDLLGRVLKMSGVPNEKS